MQCSGSKDMFSARILYYWARLYDKETGSICSENLIIIVLDLTKLPEIHNIEEIRNLPTILKWCKFLKEADNTESREIVSEICNQEVGIMGAFKSLREVSIPQKLWLWYTGRIAAEADRQMFLDLAREEGLAAGKAAGIEEGRAEGLAAGKAEGLAAGKAAGIEEGRVAGISEGVRQSAIETARNLLKMKVCTPEQIATAVNLPLETILGLQKEM